MYQINALTIHGTTSLLSDMFRHDNAIFTVYIPKLKPFTLNWTTSINFISYSTFCC